MSFIVPTERKHWRTRLLIAAMYVVVAVGALTMVYPFLIMISGSLKDRVDFDQFEVIPSFLTDDALLFKKYERARYNANMWRYQIAAKSELEIMDDIPLPDPGNGRMALDFQWFLTTNILPAPFLTLGQTVESGVQPRIQRQFRHALYRRFDGDLAALNKALGATFRNWDEISVPEWQALGRGNDAGDTPIERFHREHFRHGIPLREFWPIHVEGVFFTDLRNRYGRDIARFNAQWNTSYPRFQDVPLPRTYPRGEPHADAWETFVRSQIHEAFLRLTPRAADAFREFQQQRRIAPLSRNPVVAQTFQSAVSQVSQPADVPSTRALPTGKSAVQQVGKPAPPTVGSWGASTPIRGAHWDPEPGEERRSTLHRGSWKGEEFHPQPESPVAGTHTAGVERIIPSPLAGEGRVRGNSDSIVSVASNSPVTEFTERCPASGAARRDWLAFIEHGDCLPFVEIDSVEFRFRDHLRTKYGTLDAVNAAHGASYASFDTIPLNLPQYDLHLMTEHRREIVWEFFTRNYRHAADYLLLRGRAFWNTVIYCAGNVLLHLIVNPLAAYALSRHRLRWSHLILLFCMLTMAIPAEVGSIPRFLLIRELGLLNTFWALILPGAAHGFSIFILKGFFDGLPQDLYEAAQIEGAPERWMFWHVTLALTKPILAVTALGAFTSAYGAFLFALIICPDQKMWTISVWLYQFQQNVTEAVGFAALVLASIPVLVVFLFAQRVILRGIVLPVEK